MSPECSTVEDSATPVMRTGSDGSAATMRDEPAVEEGNARSGVGDRGILAREADVSEPPLEGAVLCEKALAGAAGDREGRARRETLTDGCRTPERAAYCMIAARWRAVSYAHAVTMTRSNHRPMMTFPARDTMLMRSRCVTARMVAAAPAHATVTAQTWPSLQGRERIRQRHCVSC